MLRACISVSHLAYHGIATPLHATPRHAVYTPRVVASRTYVRTLGHDGACTMGPGYRSCPQGRTTVYYREYRCESADLPLPLIELARLSSLLDIRWIVARWQRAPLLPTPIFDLDFKSITDHRGWLGRVVSLINDRRMILTVESVSERVWSNDWKFNVLLKRCVNIVFWKEILSFFLNRSFRPKYYSIIFIQLLNRWKGWCTIFSVSWIIFLKRFSFF